MNAGTVVRCYVKDLPFVYHYGIVADDTSGQKVVLHNTPDQGGTVITPLPEFLQGRQIINSFAGNFGSNSAIMQRFEQCRGNFNLFFYNCEHFVDAMMGRTVQRSEQVTFWLFFLFGLLLVYFVFSVK